jgi:hypothetical protein
MSVEMASDLCHMMSQIDSLEARLSIPGGQPEEQAPSSSALNELSKTVLLLRQELSAHVLPPTFWNVTKLIVRSLLWVCRFVISRTVLRLR